MWTCMECGKTFKTVKAAEKASFNGCPKCGGCDVDFVVSTTTKITTDKIDKAERDAEDAWRHANQD